jgi:DNA topoisomerase-2
MIKELQIKDFLNSGFKSFSRYDCIINIPNMIDGFKVSQRKAIYTISQKNKKNSVERYSSEIASFTCYHHAAAGMEGVLVGLAQDYPTSNNVNFLTPIGQFGNILNSAAASGRYISVEPHANFRKWFKKEDDMILEYEYEDGEQIEPKFFVPIVPTILFNGTQGIGTGYACKILNYDPHDVARACLQAVDSKKITKLIPYYQGFQGTISKSRSSTGSVKRSATGIDPVKNTDQTVFVGKFERVNTTTLRVTALPVGYSLDGYKVDLANLIETGLIKDYDDNSTDTGWDILLYTNRAFTSNDDEYILSKLKLISKESENITVWDERGKIRVFDGVEDLIAHFVKVRLELYEKRRLKLIEVTTETIRWLSQRYRFIMFYLANVDNFKNKKKDDLIALLLKNDFVDYDRLLQMPIYSLTRERIEELKKEVDEQKIYLSSLKADTAVEMYRRELKALK